MKKSFYIFLISLLIFSVGIYYLHLSWWLLLIPCLNFIFDLVFGAIYIQKNFYVDSVNNLQSSNQREICLTFDDGIHADLTPKVLDILKQKNVKAIFFLIGKNIKGNEAILKRMYDEGHQIGNHSYEHTFWFDMKSSNAMLEEIEKTTQLINSIIGKQIALFRPPYGVTNPNLARAIKKSGLQSIGWSLRSFDTTAKSTTQLLSKLKLETKAQDIVLLHDRCEITVNALTEYIDFCQERGFTFVTLKS